MTISQLEWLTRQLKKITEVQDKNARGKVLAEFFLKVNKEQKLPEADRVAMEKVIIQITEGAQNEAH